MSDQDIRNSILSDFAPVPEEPATGEDVGNAISDEALRASILNDFAPAGGAKVAGPTKTAAPAQAEWTGPGGSPSPSAQRVNDAFAAARAGGVDTGVGQRGAPLLTMGPADLLNWMHNNPKKAAAIGGAGALAVGIASGGLPMMLRLGGRAAGKVAGGALGTTGAYEMYKLLTGDPTPTVDKLLNLIEGAGHG